MPDLPPLRAVLYTPAGNSKALAKAPGLPADAWIIDLEDAVAPAAKEEARAQAHAALVGEAFAGRCAALRINGLATPWFAEDVAAAASAAPRAVVTPKVECAADVHAVERALREAGAPEHVDLWAMLETPAGVLRAAEIAAASERLTVLVMGTNDLAAELRATTLPGRAPLLFALSAGVLAARAAGKAILDGVYNRLDDPAGFEAECLQGRQLGFDGKTLIHPGQIEACRRVYSPSEAELADARKLVAAWDAAAGQGVVVVDGRMVENLHVVAARRVLAQAGP